MVAVLAAEAGRSGLGFGFLTVAGLGRVSLDVDISIA